MNAGNPADTTAAAEALPAETLPECEKCLKAPPLCVCEEIVPISNRVALLILQHPQEQDKMLGTARLAALHFRDATFRVGLSWSSLAKALGRPADPKRWAILYLGAVSGDDLPPGREIAAVDIKGAALPNQKEALANIEGVVVLDGTWSQAKTLWWRNPWVLKAQRVVLAPHQPSRYGKLRREPRQEGLSTLEAAALLLSRLENRPEIEEKLHAGFDRLLAAYRTMAPPKTTKPDRRRFKRPGGPRSTARRAPST